MGLLFSKKRVDGNLVEPADPMLSVMPYAMRSRTEAQVAYTFTVELDVIDAFIREKRREGKRITFFQVIIAAFLKVIGERPSLNRFVAGRRLYQHHEFDILYVVKPRLTDDSNESVARVSFEEDDTIYDVSEKMTAQTQAIQNQLVMKDDDKIIRQVLRLPRWLLRAVFATYRWLDFHGIAPRKMIEAIPFYSTIFVSHLGTVGADSAIHHLYEMGTCSIFCVIGKQRDIPVRDDDGGVMWTKGIDLSLTIDERICDGYYFVKSLRLMERYLRDPWLLEYPGINIPIKRTEKCSAFKEKQRKRKQKQKELAQAAKRKMVEDVLHNMLGDKINHYVEKIVEKTVEEYFAEHNDDLKSDKVEDFDSLKEKLSDVVEEDLEGLIQALSDVLEDEPEENLDFADSHDESINNSDDKSDDEDSDGGEKVQASAEPKETKK